MSVVARAGGVHGGGALEGPAAGVITGGGWVVAAEQAIEILGVLVALVHQERRVGIGEDVLPEVQLVGQDS